MVISTGINSVSLPGGYIYLTSGLILNAKNEDQVAGVFAHQLAHAAARHWAASLSKVTILQFAMVPASLVDDAPVFRACSGFVSYRYHTAGEASSAYLAGSNGSYMVTDPPTLLKFRCQDELEADYLGLQCMYMYKAGYDPGAYVELLRRLASLQPGSPPASNAFQSLPPFPERIARAEEEIRTILPRTKPPAKPTP